MTVTSKSLQPAVVNERVSRIVVNNDTVQEFFGVKPGGPSTRTVDLRTGAYDIFDDSREVAEASRPGAPATDITRQAVGRVFYSVPRSSEKVSLLYEAMNQQRVIGGQSQDMSGAVFTSEQERIIRQRQSNMREFQLAAMCRGSYTYTRTGDRLTHGFSGGAETVNFQIPAGNLNQMDMLGDGDIITNSWATASTNILDDCWEVDDALVELTGRGLSHIFLNSSTWRYIPANTQVQNEAGSSNTPFETLQSDPQRGLHTATLAGLPGVTWHINNNRVALAGTQTKLFGANKVTFMTEMDSTMVRYMECGEPVAEWEGRPKTMRYGEYYWARELVDPDRVEIHGLSNGLPELLVPKAIATGDVTS